MCFLINTAFLHIIMVKVCMTYDLLYYEPIIDTKRILSSFPNIKTSLKWVSKE